MQTQTEIQNEPKIRRVSIVNLRLSSDEKALWQSQAADAGMTLADFLRAKTTGAASTFIEPRKQRRPSKHPDADPRLIHGVSRIATNLNQILKWANTFKSKAEAREILIALISIDENIRDYLPPYVDALLKKDHLNDC